MRFGKHCFGAKLAQGRIATSFDQHLCRTQEFACLRHIVTGKQGPILGSAQFSVSNANIAYEVSLGALQRQKRDIALGGSDCDPRTALAAQLETLTYSQGSFGAAETLKHARPGEVLNLNA